MHFFLFFLQPLPDCHHFLLFGGFLFRLWCSPPLRFVDYFLSRSARTIFSFHSRLVVTAAGRVCFLSVSCCRACGVGRLPRRCPLSTRGRFDHRVRHISVMFCTRPLKMPPCPRGLNAGVADAACSLWLFTCGADPVFVY